MDNTLNENEYYTRKNEEDYYNEGFNNGLNNGFYYGVCFGMAITAIAGYVCKHYR